MPRKYFTISEAMAVVKNNGGYIDKESGSLIIEEPGLIILSALDFLSKKFGVVWKKDPNGPVMSVRKGE